MDAIPANIEVSGPVMGFCGSLVAPLQDLLGADLSAIYLYGSVTVGDFDPQSSDLDILLVVAGSLSVSAKSGLIRLLWDTAPRVPARGMECWVVTEEMVASQGVIRDYELMVSTHPQEPMTVDGAVNPGRAPLVDLDLVRETGMSVFGPSASELIAVVPRAVILGSMVTNLQQDAPDSPESYGVLNAARSLVYLETGRHVSKLEGGRWILAQGSAPLVVEQALQTQMGLVPDHSLTISGRRFVDEIIQKLESEI